MVALFVLPLGCLGSACSIVWRFGWQFYQVSPASWTCFQAHRHRQIWNRDQKWNQEELNKGQKNAVSQTEEWLKVGSSSLPAKWKSFLSHPESKADVVLATHTTDTSWQNDFSWWWFQRCHLNWVSQPRYRHKPFGGLSCGSRCEGVPLVNNQASNNLLFHKIQMLLYYCWYILTKWNVRKSGLKDSMSLLIPLWIIQT